ncbi:MAG: class I SAM-dependent methyltransferase [Stellaceae bacterium]
MLSFLPSTKETSEWQSLFDTQASAPGGDTPAALDYRTARQQHYLVDGLRAVFRGLPDGARVLDVGCGNGTFWGRLAPRQQVLGIDYSLSMCMRARERGMFVYNADALSLPFGSDQFDLVYSFEMLQYLAEPAALLAEFARVCKPGGRIAISTINRTSLLRLGMRLFRTVKPVRGGPATLPMTLRTADDIAAAARGLPLSLETVFWTHFPLPWNRCATKTRSLFEPLATNVIVSFVKPPGGAVP